MVPEPWGRESPAEQALRRVAIRLPLASAKSTHSVSAIRVSYAEMSAFKKYIYFLATAHQNLSTTIKKKKKEVNTSLFLSPSMCLLNK